MFAEEKERRDNRRIQTIFYYIHLRDDAEGELHSNYMMTISLPGKVIAICVAPNWIMIENPHIEMYIVGKEENKMYLEALTREKLLKKIQDKIDTLKKE